MSRPRAHSNLDGQREPHSVSLKVLRLSRPSLAHQYPPPAPTSEEVAAVVPPSPALSYPSADPQDSFILSPLVQEPAQFITFGSAYVGETFSCTLCTNNELPKTNIERVIGAVRIAAEIQTPSRTLPLDLSPPDEEGASNELEPSESLQKIVRYELKEEGNHVLAVTVTYTETVLGQGEADSAGGQAASGRVRTFRKLYQFQAQHCISVRTKSGVLPPLPAVSAAPKGKGAQPLPRFSLEAQLENMGEASVSLENVTMIPKAPFLANSLNWDVASLERSISTSPVLNPGDVMQVAFVLERQAVTEAVDVIDDKVSLGQMSIEWRGRFGDYGCLTTAMLTSRKQ